MMYVDPVTMSILRKGLYICIYKIYLQVFKKNEHSLNNSVKHFKIWLSNQKCYCLKYYFQLFKYNGFVLFIFTVLDFYQD